VALVTQVEVGEGGVALLVSNGLLKEHETRDRKAVGKACLVALEQWGRRPSHNERLRALEERLGLGVAAQRALSEQIGLNPHLRRYDLAALDD
jgi:hypothetical protein